jgi:hypothetical protein
MADWCLFRAVPSNKVYVLFGGAKFHVPDDSILASLYPDRPVWEVADSYADYLPNVPSNGTLLHDSSDGKVFVIVGGGKFHIPDETTLRDLYCPMHPSPTCYGNLWHAALTSIPDAPANGALLHDVSDGKVYAIVGGGKIHVPDETVLRDFYCPSYPQGACFTTLWHGAFAAIPNSPANGTLLRDTADGSVYVIFGGARFHIPNENVLQETYCPFYPQQTCSQDIWHQAITGTPTVPADDTLLREADNPAVYALCQGSRWWIPSETAFAQLGYSWSSVGLLWQGALSAVPVEANSDVGLLPPGDRQCDKVDADDDNDALTDADELSVYVTNPLNPDTDNDTRLDGADNCANWSNAAQALPAWPVASGDTDCDGFSRARETTIGTSAARQCPATATPNDEAIDSWPTDMDDNRTTNLTDILLMGSAFNKQSFDLGFKPRFDLNADGKVNMGDLVLFGPYYNRSCS